MNVVKHITEGVAEPLGLVGRASLRGGLTFAFGSIVSKVFLSELE